VCCPTGSAYKLFLTESRISRCELWINRLPQRKIAGNAQKYRQTLQTIQQRREAA
jgi:hypothetical protein